MINISENKVGTIFYEYPFKTWIIDDAVYHADSLALNFPRAQDDWYKYDNHFEKKRAMDKREKLPTIYADFLADMNMNPRLSYLSELTGIKGLIGDPALRGGGLHQIFRGGKLDIHVDFNWHHDLKLHRRLNVLLYLNPAWREEWGGHLECWDKEMKECQIKILPIHNRMVIFETTDFSFHGHPEPLNCPPDRTRNSMAWYFYSAERPAHEITEAHSTLFKRRPNEATTIEIEDLRAKRNRGRL